jgi:hypothetical protein
LKQKKITIEPPQGRARNEQVRQHRKIEYGGCTRFSVHEPKPRERHEVFLMSQTAVFSEGPTRQTAVFSERQFIATGHVHTVKTLFLLDTKEPSRRKKRRL